MDSVSLRSKTSLDTKATGTKANTMDKARTSHPVEPSTQAIGPVVSTMVSALLNGQTVQFTKVNGRTVGRKGMASLQESMALFMREAGCKASTMAKDD